MITRILSGLLLVGLLMATAVGCNKNKNDTGNPGNAPVDAATAPVYPPAQ